MHDRPNQPAQPESETGTAFDANRKRIGLFFETKNLRGLIKEFYAVQNSFHRKMQNLVTAFRDHSGELTDQQQKMLEKLLYPYGILIANPFQESESGDIEKDILHILSVINARNQHFEKILPAMLIASANLQDFNAFLEVLKREEPLRQALLQSIQAKSWLDMEGHVDLPRQNLMRYELLLTSIRKELEKAGCTSTEPVLVNIMDAISFIMPELQYINKHRKTLQYLGSIDALLDSLATIEALQGCITETDAAGKFTFPAKVNCVRNYIDNSMLAIARGRGDIIEILTALHVSLDHLQEGVAETLMKERQTYLSQGYRLLVGVTEYALGENVVFSKRELDPRERLPLVVADLQQKIRNLEAARSAYGYLKERSPDFDPDIFDVNPATTAFKL